MNISELTEHNDVQLVDGRYGYTSGQDGETCPFGCMEWSASASGEKIEGSEMWQYYMNCCRSDFIAQAPDGRLTISSIVVNEAIDKAEWDDEDEE
jgi:hypothetical protein